MDFSEISARMRKQRDEEAAAAATPVDHAESYRVRARMVGVLLRDAREAAQRSYDDCARLLDVSPALVESWEYGDATPSLPQLEILAHFLAVPVSHFWSASTLQSEASHPADAQREFLALRDRMIGALLRQAREIGGISLEALSGASGLPVEQIEQYELGELPVPMHELIVLAHGVNRNVNTFLESGSHIGEWLALREAWKQLAAMPEELRKFVLNPLHHGFIEIAMVFSQMPTDRLRKVGESFLDITM